MTVLASTRILSTEPEYVGSWMAQSGAVTYRDGATCLGLERDGHLVAGTLYDHFNGASLFCNIVITGPITRRWLYTIFHYPFVQLGARVLIGLVAQDNLKSLRFVQHLGFHLAVSLPHADPSGWMNIMILYREECRFLRRPYV